MALGGDQYPEIRIEVDQRLPMEEATLSDTVEDASVSTEITYFDRIGDTYILEGALSFSGMVESASRQEGNESRERVPIDYRLPFALRVPLDGQPDYLDVKTRMKDWEIAVLEPNFLQVKAQLTVQGLDARNGYAFYCGDQEDWVQPQVEAAEVFKRDSEEAGYNEQDWLMEQQEAADEQDTLVFEPGTGWQEQINRALESAASQGKSPTQEEDVRAREDAQEEVFQFEALADEVVTPNPMVAQQMEVPAASSVVEFKTDPERKLVGAASPLVEKARPEVEQAAPAKLAEAEAAQTVEAATDETETAELPEMSPPEPVKAGPKISLGASKEAPSSLKLSGLATGSVTKADRSEEQSQEPEQQATVAEEESPADSELADEQTPTSDSNSLWGHWIKVESEKRYTLKFKIVQETESLNQVAERYDLPIENLMRVNGLTNEEIAVGQILLIPGRRP